MLRFFMFVSILALLFYSWPAIKQWRANDFEKEVTTFQAEINKWKNNKEVQDTLSAFRADLQQVLNQSNSNLQKPEVVKKTVLKTPSKQLFSIHNIELGQSKATIEQQLGTAKRSTYNDYGTNWFTYHKNYHDFLMVMYDSNKKATGIYTNQDLISSRNGIKLGSSKEYVRKKLGKPVTSIQKGLMILQLQKNSDYDIYPLDGMYITIFYDKHQNNTVTAMQLISKKLELTKTAIYPKANAALKEGFELQLFDLTNAARVQHQLRILKWDEHVRITARNHSTDMAVHNYFDHTDLEGKSPFDRMQEDNILFHLAGENIAYGQFSSIFAHEGLMNSLGHRKNILQKDFRFLGVGVAFNSESQPFYTQDFYAK